PSGRRRGGHGLRRPVRRGRARALGGGARQFHGDRRAQRGRHASRARAAGGAASLRHGRRVRPGIACGRRPHPSSDARAHTPGTLDPDVPQVNIHSTICVPGWTATIRPPPDYTDALKVKQMREYGETGPPSAYEEDHLISLELGGAPRDPRNLWPEPRPRADEGDRIANEANAKAGLGELPPHD